MDKDSNILIVGHDDIIEQSLRNHFERQGYHSVISSSAIGLNPTIQVSVYEFFQKYRPEYVFLASTRSGGIKANQDNGGDFIYHNLESQNNILYAARKFDVKKLLYFAGSCVYPKECPQPMTEDALLTGPLELTSEPYSVAKIAGIKLCQAFRRQYHVNAVVMVPATVYGPGSSVNLETAHVMGALIGKFTQAVRENRDEVIVWGSGNPRREFLFADDFVDACLFLMKRYEDEAIINAGFGSDVAIKELAEMIANVTGFKGKISFDESKPDGTPQKLLNSQRIHDLGWRAQMPLEEGIRKTYEWYKNQ